MKRQLAEIELPKDLEQLSQEYRFLQRFLHLVPVGLMRVQENGDIAMMNPMAVQLLGPLGLDHGEINLFNLLDPVSQDIRILCKTFSEEVGLICENFCVVLPAASAGADSPWALGLTVMRVSAKDGPLVVVVTDQTGALKLQRLQSKFARGSER